MNKLDMETKNITNENIEKIASLFPNVIVESDKGISIDFDLLKQELSDVAVDDTKEKYQLTWPGKRESIINANTPTTKTLRPLKDKSVDFDNTENIYIEGDNLEVLKILQESYLNKIKCIYIDPPYNTGKDFIYNDNFNKNSKDELEESGQIDEYGNRMISNSQSNGRYHSDWLSMMYPRLKLARNLLTYDGVIFISIDENEFDNLKKICDDIFGSNNFRNKLIVRRRNKSLNQQFATNGLKTFNVGCEYVLVYSKSSAFSFNPIRMLKKNKITKGTWNVFWSNADRPTMRYEILGFTPETGQWRWQESLANEAMNNYNEYLQKYSDNITLEEYWEKNGKKMKFLRRINNGKGKNGGVQYWVAPSDSSLRTTNWTDIEVSQIAKDYDLPFENPKNISLINELLQSVPGNDFYILDFFSGSATTAESVLRLNNKNNSSLKFILVQLPDKISEPKVKFNYITDIGQERIRLSIKKIQSENSSCCNLGFRVYKVDSSNMKDIYYKPDDFNQEQLGLFESNIKDDRNNHDILTQVILDLGLTLDLKINEKDILGNKVYFVDDNSLVACFDENINLDIIEDIASYDPLKVVFKDESFIHDNDKINLIEKFKKLSPDTEINIL